MKVLDLFSGLGGWSNAFKERGHEVITVDIEPKFNPTICADISKLTGKDFTDIDVVLASPPCECFSMLSVYRHWKNGKPSDEATRKSIQLVQHTLELVKDINPKYWVLENPVGMLRTLPFTKFYNHRVITQCQYGERRMKPTDLWGRFPPTFSARKCKNNSKCHDRTPRGSHDSGTQMRGLSSAERAKIPHRLGLEFCVACEVSVSSEVTKNEDL